MKKYIIYITLVILPLFCDAQNFILQNNKFIMVSPAYSISYSLGELGNQRNKFYADFNKIQESKDLEVKAKFLPRNTFGFNTKMAVKFNPHIYIGLNLGYQRKGHIESFEKFNAGLKTFEYEMTLNMDYLTAGMQLILFHPKNFHLYIGFDNNYNVRDDVTTYSKDLTTGVEDHNVEFFVEYYEKWRKIFLPSFTFGGGYIYRSFGVDLNCSLSGNAFMTTTKDLKFFTTSVGFTYYFLKRKNESLLKAEDVTN